MFDPRVHPLHTGLFFCFASSDSAIIESDEQHKISAMKLEKPMFPFYNLFIFN